MRFVTALSTMLLLSTACAASAQSGAPNTLDGQMKRLQQNKGMAAPAPAIERKTFDSVPVGQPAVQQRVAPQPNPQGLPVAKNGEVIDSIGSGAIPALPLELLTENGVSYISGGIGDEEVAQLKAQEAQYNIQLTITNGSGAYASNVVLTLKDAKGASLVSINDAGPKVFFRAPAGSYTVETNDGKKLVIKAPAKGAAKAQVRVAG